MPDTQQYIYEELSDLENRTETAIIALKTLANVEERMAMLDTIEQWENQTLEWYEILGKLTYLTMRMQSTKTYEP